MKIFLNIVLLFVLAPSVSFAAPSQLIEKENIIIFDWDNTLYPTSRVQRNTRIDIGDNQEIYLKFLEDTRDRYQAKVVVVSRGNVFTPLLPVESKIFKKQTVQEAINTIQDKSLISFIGIKELQREFERVKQRPLRRSDRDSLKELFFTPFTSYLRGKQAQQHRGRIIFVGDLTYADSLDLVPDALLPMSRDDQLIRRISSSTSHYLFIKVNPGVGLIRSCRWLSQFYRRFVEEADVFMNAISFHESTFQGELTGLIDLQ